MGPYDSLFDLEGPVCRLCDSVSAVRAFWLALEQENSDLAGGLWSVWDRLNSESEAVRAKYYSCIDQFREQI